MYHSAAEVTGLLTAARGVQGGATVGALQRALKGLNSGLEIICADAMDPGHDTAAARILRGSSRSGRESAGADGGNRCCEQEPGRSGCHHVGEDGQLQMSGQLD